MVTVEKYGQSCKSQWDELVRISSNGTLLHYRDFMEYHAYRFEDYSLTIYDNDELIAVLPANQNGDQLITHQGLTFGGLVLQKEIKLHRIIDCFDAIVEFLKNTDIKSILYKTVPAFYHTTPSFGDEYALFRLKADLTRRDTSFVTDLKKTINFQKRRLRSIRKAERLKVAVKQEDAFDLFWHKVLEPNLVKRFGVKPVHSLKEITYLKNRFPSQIVQYCAYLDDELVAGCTLFISGDTVHAQYISATDIGRSSGAIDLLFYELMTKIFNEKQYFSFGISNEDNGYTLNHGLADWKEGFDAKVWLNNFYLLNIGS